MNIVIWGAIYVVLSVMLGLFLFKEKQIIEFFKEKKNNSRKNRKCNSRKEIKR